MRGILAVIALLALWCAPPALAAAAQPEGEPLVSVNGHLITSADVDRHLRMLAPIAAHGADASAATAIELDQMETQRRRDALQALVELQLLYDVARDEYMAGEQAQKMLDQAAEDELRRFEERVGSMPASRRVLAGVGLSVGQYKELQKQNLLANKLLWDKVLSRVLVTPAETRQYYDTHAGEFARPRTIVFRQMLFVVADPAAEQEQRARADAALARLRKGEDFAQVARAVSAQVGTDPAGLVRVGVPDSAPDWRPPPVEGLEPGQTSEVRQLPAGYSIARLEEVRPPGPQPFGEVQPAIKEAMLQVKRESARTAYLDELKSKARIEYKPAAQDLMPK